jgi:5-methylcytosine-specific restriction endonuclease McrA
MTHEVLLLNADAQPISFLPLSSISWQDAIHLIYLDRADALHNYEDWFVHSPSVTMQVPSVMMLRKQVRNVRQWMARDHIQKDLVFLRDMFTCQYCTKQFTRSRLTLDHVIPRVLGGRTKWDNVTTACFECNCNRGCDATVLPRTKPFRPTYSLLLRNMRSFPIAIPSSEWNFYLQWDPDKIHLVQPHSRKTHNGFDFGGRFALESYV